MKETVRGRCMGVRYLLCELNFAAAKDDACRRTVRSSRCLVFAVEENLLINI